MRFLRSTLVTDNLIAKLKGARKTLATDLSQTVLSNETRDGIKNGLLIIIHVDLVSFHKALLDGLHGDTLGVTVLFSDSKENHIRDCWSICHLFDVF